MIHALTCPIRRRWLRRRDHMPFWRDDKVAQMLGIAWYGCPRCGRGAVEQRDADPMRDTCPTLCVERNHPGREHDAWLSEIRQSPGTSGGA